MLRTFVHVRAGQDQTKQGGSLAVIAGTCQWQDRVRVHLEAHGSDRPPSLVTTPESPQAGHLSYALLQRKNAGLQIIVRQEETDLAFARWTLRYLPYLPGQGRWSAAETVRL